MRNSIADDQGVIGFAGGCLLRSHGAAISVAEDATEDFSLGCRSPRPNSLLICGRTYLLYSTLILAVHLLRSCFFSVL
jgi:hypothetical protein